MRGGNKADSILYGRAGPRTASVVDPQLQHAQEILSKGKLEDILRLLNIEYQEQKEEVPARAKILLEIISSSLLEKHLMPPHYKYHSAGPPLKEYLLEGKREEPLDLEERQIFEEDIQMELEDLLSQHEQLDENHLASLFYQQNFIAVRCDEQRSEFTTQGIEQARSNMLRIFPSPSHQRSEEAWQWFNAGFLPCLAHIEETVDPELNESEGARIFTEFTERVHQYSACQDLVDWFHDYCPLPTEAQASPEELLDETRAMLKNNLLKGSNEWVGETDLETFRYFAILAGATICADKTQAYLNTLNDQEKLAVLNGRVEDPTMQRQVEDGKLTDTIIRDTVLRFFDPLHTIEEKGSPPGKAAREINAQDFLKEALTC